MWKQGWERECKGLLQNQLYSKNNYERCATEYPWVLEHWKQSLVLKVNRSVIYFPFAVQYKKSTL